MSLYNTGIGITGTPIMTNGVTGTPIMTNVTPKQSLSDSYTKNSILEMINDRYGNKEINLANLRYRGITFVCTIEKEYLEFFADPLDISLDEFMLLEVSWPQVAKSLKASWKKAWIEFQAEKEFYKQD